MQRNTELREAFRIGNIARARAKRIALIIIIIIRNVGLYSVIMPRHSYSAIRNNL